MSKSGWQVWLEDLTGGTGVLAPDNDYNDFFWNVSVTNYDPIPTPPVGCGCDCPVDPKPQSAAGNGSQVSSKATTTSKPVRYADGVATLSAPAIGAGGFGGAWGQSRSWSNAPGYSAGQAAGTGWVDNAVPNLDVIAKDAAGSPTVLLAASDSSTARYFDRKPDGTWAGRFYDQVGLAADPAAGTYTLTDERGNATAYRDFAAGTPAGERGRFQRFTDAAGAVTAVAARAPDGKPAEVGRAQGNAVESYLYGYAAEGPAAGLMTSVTLRRSADAGATWATVRRADYAYYAPGEANGVAGTLKTATVSDGAGAAIDAAYYRYWQPGETVAGTGRAGGFAGGLKYAFGTQSLARMAADLGADPATLSDAQAAPYADNYFEYDGRRRVTKEVAGGAGCSACSAGLGTFGYEYSNNPTPGADPVNGWATKTVETLPDGTKNVVYANASGQTLLKAFLDASGTAWADSYRYDAAGRLTLHAAPSAVSGYNESLPGLVGDPTGNATYLRDADGLVTAYAYYAATTATETAPGGAAGYQQSVALRRGELGADVPQASMSYYARSAGGATVYPVASQTAYRNADGTGAQATTSAYAWYAGSTRAYSVATTLPAVTAAQNGPGVATTSTTVMDRAGRPTWMKDAGGFLTYTAYDAATGAAVKTIQDVDTARTADFNGLPAGWATPAGGGQHLVSTSEVDNQGRPTRSTSPAGRVTLNRYDDARQEVRTYPGWDDAAGRPTGPISLSRDDRAGGYSESLTYSGGPAADDFSAASPDGGWAFRGGAWSQAGGVLSQTGGAEADPKKAVLASVLGAVEVSARVRVDAATPGDMQRAGVGLGTDAASGLGYNLVFHGPGRVEFLHDAVAWGNAYAFAWQVGAWYHFKLRQEADGTLRGKIWADADAEPAAWAFTQSGWAYRAGAASLNGGSALPGQGSAAASFDDLLVTPPAAPLGSEAVTGVQSLARTYRNAAGQSVRTDTYQTLSGLGYSTAAVLGAEGVNFDRTTQDYDKQGRPNRTRSAAGTISRTFRDGQNRAVSEWVGTNDTPTTGFWSPSNPAGMTKVREFEYDGGGVGDGTVTKVTDFPGGGAAPRVTQTWFDWRDRPVATKAGVEATESAAVNRPISYADYDNLGRVVTTRLYDGDAVTLTTTNGVPLAPAGGLLRAQSAAAYDELGRAFRSQTFSVDPATGAVSAAALTSSTWFDLRGNAVKTLAPGGLVQKSAFDGLGRTTASYATDGGGDPAPGAAGGWAAALDVVGDAVLSQAESTYDADGNVTLSTRRERFHDESATGALGTPTAGVKARVSYSATYYDLAGRATDAVEVGTNGGGVYVRPAAVPARSDTALVSSVVYDAAGRASEATDPRGLKSRTTYDARGRTLKTVENYVDGVPSSLDDKTTEYAYGPAGMTSLTARLAGGGGQTTQWVYGVTAASGSGIDSNDAKSATRWPDPATGLASAAQQETVTVNALGQPLTSTDRNGTTHAVAYDVLGRVTDDAVTLLGVDVDGAVRRVHTDYDGQGNAYLMTNFTAATGGSVVSQVRRDFNGLGQLLTEYQAHGAAVNTATTPKVQYAYSALDATNKSRPASVTYPNGRVVASDYGPAGQLNDKISRLASLKDGATTLEAYVYLGLGTVVTRSHPQPGLDLTYVKRAGEANGDGGDQYTGMDRFGRLVDQRWVVAASGVAADRFGYTLDRDGNRLTRSNGVNAAFGEAYTYDGLNQLATFARGAHTQAWDYDALGNWSGVTTDGATQTRTANAQNEITAIGGAVTPTYDASGNMTGDETGRRFVYDAWNRLKVVKSAGGVVLETLGYDALSRRITSTAGATTDLYYSAGWQVLEERVGGVAKASYVWSPVYVDALVSRDRDADASSANGLEERLYALADANHNVTALVSVTGVVVERYAYDPFGKASVLDAAFAAKAGGTGYGWVVLFQGLRRDSVSGLDYARNRNYSATLGRWVTKDPIGFAAGDVNLYRFVGNDPTNATDPSGLQPPALKNRPVKQPDGTTRDELYPFSDQDKYTKKNNALGGPHQYYVVILITDDTTDEDYVGWRGSEPNAKVRVRIRNLNDAISVLDDYEDGSIGRLIISGHNRGGGCGVTVAASRFPHVFGSKDDQTPLTYKTITGDSAKKIAKKLTSDAVVVLAACQAGADPQKMQVLADNLAHPVQASDGDCSIGYTTNGKFRQVNPVGWKAK